MKKEHFNMKKVRFIFFALLLPGIMTGHRAFSQEHPPEYPGHGKYNKEKIEALKVGFITEKVNLTSKEAQQFWPVYHEMEKKTDDLRKTMHKTARISEEKLEKMNDKEVEKLIDNLIKTRKKQVQLDEEYHQKFKEILPVKKVALLYKAREDFKRHLLRKLRGKHPQKR